MSRRDPGETAGAKPTGTTLRRKKRDRSWDEKHNSQVAAYRLPLEIKQAIKDMATELDVSTAEVARALLEHGLKAYDAGDLKLQPTTKDKTLYPGD